MTEYRKDDIICYVPGRPGHMERYRSGHNEAVLKTVCPQGHMGSNPILSAGWKHNISEKEFVRILFLMYT